jgi:hypothetical protein
MFSTRVVRGEVNWREEMRRIRTVIGLKGLMVCLVFVGVSGLVIIEAPGGLSSLFRLGPSAAAAQESPLVLLSQKVAGYLR